MSTMNAMCLICKYPNEIWCDFLKEFVNYTVYVVVDDETCDISTFVDNYKNITFININHDLCISNGYTNMNFTMNKCVTGWEKAMYYFTIVNGNHPHVWFVEDDVFMMSENTIKIIDDKYPHTDLLSNCITENLYGRKNVWHWNRINISYDLPYYKGMMCAVRLSNCVLKCIQNYAFSNGTLFFLEALFPTITIKNNLTHQHPLEMNMIRFRQNYNKSDIFPTHLYHPVKNLLHHINFRN